MKGIFLLIFLATLFISCHPTRQIQKINDDGKIELVIVQVNDVYEIAPVENGTMGGMARIATVKKQELKSNKNTLLVIAGDFLSPSVYNTLKYEGKRIRGRQMIDAMNAAGFDIAVFGNHEFDITEEELQDRINESKFQWISSNSFLKRKKSIIPFEKTTGDRIDTLPSTKIYTITDADGTKARIGFLGINIPENANNYVAYTEPLPRAKILYDKIKDSCDAVIAITHQTIKSDIQLAEQIPGLALIVGGHEHDMRLKKIGNTYITKAHSNARSVYILKVKVNKKTHSVEVIPELKMIDSSIAIDSTTDQVVKKWSAIANNNYSSLGFDPKKVILNSGDSLEAREIYTRSGSSNFTDIILKAMAENCPQADIVILNSGSIRLDDILYPPVTEYDILRSLPFGGGIREVDMKGKLLKQVLDAGTNNKGTGGFLEVSPVISRIDPDKIYRVALTDYLLTGGEQNMHFLNERNPFVIKVYPEHNSAGDPLSDIRLAIIQYFQKNGSSLN